MICSGYEHTYTHAETHTSTFPTHPPMYTKTHTGPLICFLIQVLISCLLLNWQVPPPSLVVTKRVEIREEAQTGSMHHKTCLSQSWPWCSCMCVKGKVFKAGWASPWNWWAHDNGQHNWCSRTRDIVFIILSQLIPHIFLPGQNLGVYITHDATQLCYGILQPGSDSSFGLYR